MSLPNHFHLKEDNSVDHHGIALIFTNGPGIALVLIYSCTYPSLQELFQKLKVDI